MAGSEQNGKAGESCTDCDSTPTCFQQYTIKDSTGKAIIDVPLTHPGKISMTRILQSKKDANYTFEIKGNCVNGNEKCPITQLPNGEFLYGTATQEDILSYSDSYKWSNMTLLQWLKEYFVLDPTKISSRLYALLVSEHNSMVHLATLAVYPTYKLSIKFTYGKEISAAKVEDRKSRYQYTRAEAKKITKQAGKKWSQLNKELSKVESENGLSGEAEIGEFEESIGLTFNEKERYSDDNPIFKIKSLINKVNDSLLSNNGNIGPVRDITLIGPNIEITGAKELKQNGNNLYFEYSATAEFAPLIGVRATIDLIDVALQCLNAALPSVGSGAAKAWRELRKAMLNAKNNYETSDGKGGYVSVGVDLILTGEMGNCSVKIYNTANNKPAGEGKVGGKMKAEVKGYIEGEAKVWVIKGSLSASGSAETGIGASLLVDPEGIGACWEHDGVKIKFEGEIAAGINDDPDYTVDYSITPIVLTLADPYESEPNYIFAFNSK